MSTDVEALAQATRAPLPTDPATFDADERISFSKVSNTFLLEAEDGQEFEWEHALKRWVPAVSTHNPGHVYTATETVQFVEAVTRACS